MSSASTFVDAQHERLFRQKFGMGGLMGSATQDLNEANGPSSASDLLPEVYHELRQLAAFRLKQMGPGQTIQATALVHEAYLKLTKGKFDESCWANNAHFFAAASEAMRQIVIDRYRRKHSLKRGGGTYRRSDLDCTSLPTPAESIDLLAINEAIDALEKQDPQEALLVKLRFFSGMTMAEAAAAMEVPRATAEAYWRYARAFLAHHLGDRS